MLIGMILMILGWAYDNSVVEIIGLLCCLASLACIAKVIVCDTERR